MESNQLNYFQNQLRHNYQNNSVTFRSILKHNDDPMLRVSKAAAVPDMNKCM
jgi:hypothetical protein